MTLSFRYRADASLDKVRRPYILFKALAFDGKPVEVSALLDSGADVSLVPRSLDETLVLDLSGEQTEATGVGGKIKVIISSLEIKLGRGSQSFRLTIPVKVPVQPEAAFHVPLIGREVFFDNFDITFKQNKKRVWLKKVKPE